MCPTKLLIIVITKCWSNSKISAILWSLLSVFTLFYLILRKTCELMGENVVFLVKFDTCDVMYNWSISLLPPIRLLYLIIYLLRVWFSNFQNYKHKCRIHTWSDKTVKGTVVNQALPSLHEGQFKLLLQSL